MAREFYEIERGLSVTSVNSNTVAYQLLHGSAVPGGDAGEQDNAPVGSIYFRTGTAQLYQKVASANATSDWNRIAFASEITGLSWRSDRVVAVTDDADPGNTTIGTGQPYTAFSDDDGSNLPLNNTVFTVGDYIIFDANGDTGAVLKQVTAVSATTITVSDSGVTVLSDNDAFVAINYLPDSPDGQEGRALVVYDSGSTSMLKIGDVDWNFATGINLSATYAAVNGTISSSDTVESAIAKLNGNQLDILTTIGVAAGAVDLGTFTGTTISDNVSVKTALQELETAIESFGIVNSENESVSSTTVTLDSVLVDEAYAVKWFVHAIDETNNEVSAFEVWATHDGEASADATTVDDTLYAKLKIGGGVAGINISVDLNGTGAAQAMRLRVSCTNTAKFRAKRIEVIDIA